MVGKCENSAISHRRPTHLARNQPLASPKPPPCRRLNPTVRNLCSTRAFWRPRSELRTLVVGRLEFLHPHSALRTPHSPFCWLWTLDLPPPMALLAPEGG